MFDKTSGLPLHTVDLNTEIEDFEYNADDLWTILNRHPSASSIKAMMADPTVDGFAHHDVDREDSDFIAKGIFAFQYNPTSHLVEKVTPG